MSLLALGAVLEGRHDYSIVDGNVNRKAFHTVRACLRSNPSIDILGVSVMAGTQMVNAIRQCRILKKDFPHVRIVWGGYFPSMHSDSTLNSSYVDFVIRGQGERSFLELVDTLREDTPFEKVCNLSYRSNGVVRHNPEYPIFDPNDRPLFPYEKLRMEDYAIPTFVGERTFCHDSSTGCPHKCNFCGVVHVFHSRWKAEAPERTREVVRVLKRRYRMDGLEFHDSDFFVSEKRVRELSERLVDEKIKWWAEGRIDTILKYDYQTMELMQSSGCKMIFFGAESGYDETLRLMDKGGVTAEKTKEIAARCRQFDIQPEFSFVMGSNPDQTRQDIDATIDLIHDLKRINPKSVIFPFIYTPVPIGDIYRQNPQTPWLTKPLLKRLKNFRTVLAAHSARTNDQLIAKWKQFVLRLASSWRYRYRWYAFPIELKILLRLLTANSSPKHESF